ncbi:hypothetical protein QTP88_014822 [Uroleucon formosanum]
MSTHISKLINLERKLSLAGEPVTDNMVMKKILMTSPNEYNHFNSALDLGIKGEIGGQEKSSAFPAKFQNKSSEKKAVMVKAEIPSKAECL